MSATFALLAAAVGAVVAGTLIGSLTGVLPGLHVNTVAPLVLLLVLGGALPGPSDVATTAAVLLILCVAVVHTILNVVPTVAAPIPDEGNALVLLPIQRMASEGRAIQALRLSVRSSWLGGTLAALVALAVLLAWPGGAPPLPPAFIRTSVTGILVLLILRHPRPGPSLVVFFLSGAAGFLLLGVSLRGPFGGDGSILLPVFSGLFALPMLLVAILTPTPPGAASYVERDAVERAPSPLAGLTGTLCGLLVAALPGLTTATAGSFGRALRRPRDDAEDVAMLSAVDTANVVGNSAALLVWGATRSGASAAVRVARPDTADAGASQLAALCIAALVAAVALGSWIALTVGPRIVARLRSVPPRPLAGCGLALLVVILLLHGGIGGLLVAALLVPLGLLPHRWETPRALLMGFLLVPYLVSLYSA